MATFAGLRDPSLRELASRLESTVIASRATGTTDAYRRAFLRWRSFTASSDEIQTFSAKPEHVALYLQHVLDTTKSHSSVDSAIYSIQWAHNLADVPSPTNSPIVHAISRASKRIIVTQLFHLKLHDFNFLYINFFTTRGCSFLQTYPELGINIKSL